MQKHSAILVVMGGLVAGGMGLSVWGNEVLFEEFAKAEGRIGAGQALEVGVAMERQSGVFAVEVIEMAPGTVHATVTDPDGNEILRERVDGEAYEGYFDAGIAGNYTLTVHSSDREERLAAGYIGPEPDAAKRSIAFVSVYILVIGLAGMLISIAYAAIARRR